MASPGVSSAPGRAEFATVRFIAVGAGIAAILILVAAGAVAAQDTVPVEPTPVTWLTSAALVLMAATGAISRWSSVSVIRVWAGVAAGMYAASATVALLQTVLEYTVFAAEFPTASVMRPWAFTAVSPFVAAGFLAFGIRGAWGILALGATATQLHRILSNEMTPDSIANDTHSVFTGLVLGLFGLVALQRSRALDIAADGRIEAARVAAAERGRLAALRRSAALVHDEVLSVLRLAGSDLRVDRAELAEEAESSRTLLTDLGHEPAPEAQWIDAITADVHDIDADASLTVHHDGSGPAVEPPARVQQALRRAVRQALDNSLRHAGQAARRQVILTGTAGSIEISVHDDGVGFTPGKVKRDRLGVRASIEQSLVDVGGEALVESAPGEGTTVSLLWRLPSSASAATETVPKPPRGGFFGQSTPQGRFTLWVTVAGFAITQIIVAAAAVSNGASPVTTAICLIAVLIAVEVLRRAQTSLEGWRTAVVVSLALGCTVLGVIGSSYGYGAYWFSVASAALLAACALLGALQVVVWGGLFVVGTVVVTGVLMGLDPLTIVIVSYRPAMIVLLTFGAVVALNRIRRRTDRAHARAAADSSRAVQDAAMRTELKVRGREVSALVDPLLAEVASGRELHDSDRMRAQALEGVLRDQLRAGRLAIEPLVSEAMQARQRGVDIVLLDDGDQAAVGIDLEKIAAWMARGIAGAQRQAVGRLLPPERHAVATLVVDGEPESFTAPGGPTTSAAALQAGQGQHSSTDQ